MLFASEEALKCVSMSSANEAVLTSIKGLLELYTITRCGA